MLGAKGLGSEATLSLIPVSNVERATTEYTNHRITSHDENFEMKVDKMRVLATEAGLILVNIQIGNVFWEEYKESYTTTDDGSDNGDGGGCGGGVVEGSDGGDIRGDSAGPIGRPPKEKHRLENHCSGGAADILQNLDIA